MLGWNIYIRRNTNKTSNEESAINSYDLLASWTAGMGGVDWLDELVNNEKSAYQSNRSFPLVYISSAEVILPKIIKGPPNHKGPEVIGDDYSMTGGWISDFIIDREKCSECTPGTLLLIEAWDLS